MNSAATLNRKSLCASSVRGRSVARIFLATVALAALLSSSIVAQDAVDPPPLPFELPKIEIEKAPLNDLWQESDEDDTKSNREQREVRLQLLRHAGAIAFGRTPLAEMECRAPRIPGHIPGD